jgi:hypothetical protein
MPSSGTVRAPNPAESGAKTPIGVGFLYIAQAHHLLHSISVAVELARRRPDFTVEVVTTSADALHYARLLVGLIGPDPISWRLLGPRWLPRLSGPPGNDDGSQDRACAGRLVAGRNAIPLEADEGGDEAARLGWPGLAARGSPAPVPE